MNSIYRTRDLAEAAFLYTCHKKLIGHNEDNGKVWFVFENKADCEKLAQSFWGKEATVNAKELCDSLRTLKDIIFNRERK